MSSALCRMNPKQDRAGFCRGNRGNRGWINWDGPGNPAPANRLAHDPAGIRTSKRERLSRKRRFIQPLTDLPRDRMAAPPKRKPHPAQYPNVQAGEPVPKTAVYPAVDGFHAGQPGRAAKKEVSSGSVPARLSGSACPKNGGSSRRWRISRGAARPRRQQKRIFFCDLLDIPRNI